MDYDKETLGKSGVYAIVNTVTGCVYIGFTGACFRRRWGLHRTDLARNVHCNKSLQSDWNLYGPGAFEFRVLEAFPGYRIASDYLRCREWLYTEQFPSLYNIDLRKPLLLRSPNSDD